MQLLHSGLIVVLILSFKFSLLFGQQPISAWGSWSQWTPCSVTCGYGSIHKTVYWYDENGKQTNDTMSKQAGCFLDVKCPINGNWTMWSPFSPCSSACGPAKRNRTRECTNPIPANGGSKCYGAEMEEKECNLQDCPPLPPNFDLESCNVGDKFMCSRKQMCLPKTERCDGTVQCNDGSDEYLCYRNEASGFQRPGLVVVICSLFALFSLTQAQ